MWPGEGLHFKGSCSPAAQSAVTVESRKMGHQVTALGEEETGSSV